MFSSSESSVLTRPATRAGSWYPGNKDRLEMNIKSHFRQQESVEPTTNTRIIIGPHAGHRYCGEILAQSYSALDATNIKTVFIFSPSHYVYFRGARVSKYSLYETPFGNFDINKDLCQEFVKYGEENDCYDHSIKYFKLSSDDKEHGIEIHLPYLYYKFLSEKKDIPKLVPIVIGDISDDFESIMAGFLNKYIGNKEYAFVISSDFCHWGFRFRYVKYTGLPDISTLIDLESIIEDDDYDDGYENEIDALKYYEKHKKQIPIYKSIELLDQKAMKIASSGSYLEWKKYLKFTENTICGANGISVILLALENEKKYKRKEFEWIGYSQSSKVTDIDDSSVSYASGFITLS